MLDSFVAFDIEMPSRYVPAISAIGITVVVNGKIVETYYTLVNPETSFSKYVIDLVGITPKMVKNSPTLPEVWNRVKYFFNGENIIVAHGANGDLNTLVLALNRYGIRIENELKYVCTCDVSIAEDKNFKGHSLDYLCRRFEIELDHHNAQSDSDGCALLLLHYLKSGVDIEKYIVKTNGESYISKHFKKLTLQKIEKSAKTSQIGKEATSILEKVERNFDKKFELLSTEEEKRALARRVGIKMKYFGVPAENIKFFCDELSKSEMNFINDRCRRFRSFEMYKVYFEVFKRKRKTPGLFSTVVSQISIPYVFEDIDVNLIFSALNTYKLSIDDFVEAISKTSKIGFACLDIELIKRNKLHLSNPDLAIKVISAFNIKFLTKNRLLRKECVLLLAQMMQSGGSDADKRVSKMRISKKALEELYTISKKFYPEIESRVSAIIRLKKIKNK